jgi:signal transduction histidine kinase
MTLRSKILMVLVPVVGGYAVVDHAVQRAILRPSFDELEREHAVRDMERTRAAIDSEVAHVAERAMRLAESEAIRAFVRGDDPGYGERVLRPQSSRKQGPQLLWLLDADGRVLWGDARRTPEGPSLTLREFPTGRFSTTHRLAPEERPFEVVQGLWNTEEGPLLVASVPVLPDDEAATVRGRLVLGRFLAGTTFDRIFQRTRVPFAVWSLDSSTLPAPVRAVLDEATSSPHPIVRNVDDREAHVYATLSDVRRQPAVLLRIASERSISQRGASAIDYALLSTFAAGLVLVLVLSRLLQRVVVDPLARLTQHAVEIGRSDDSGLRLAMRRDDEIGTLAGEFDAMLAKLEASRAAVVTAARAAGMSEIATGVLHNVGNVLNSVTVSTGVIGEKVRGSRLPQLEKLAKLLEEHRDGVAEFLTQDPKGQKVVPFVVALTRQLSDERAGLEAEIRHLEEALEHIRQLIASQQAHAGRSTLLEPADVAEQIEMALRLSDKAPGAAKARIERDIPPLPRLAIDRHKVVEILVNLVQNARQSLAEAKGADPVVHVSARLEDGTLRIRIRDNGVGIPHDNLARIFNHGFTTKPGGHGFGLHASANAAVEMGGRLTAASDGPGRGALFTLEIPVTGAATALAS